MASELERLYDAVVRARDGAAHSPKTTELFEAGSVKIAKKVVEESAEVSLAYANQDDAEVVRETADLLYNLVVLLVDRGVRLEDIWDEMASREAVLGMAGKVPKDRRSDVDEAPPNGNGNGDRHGGGNGGR